jgi:Type II CAAX prenyl endopeptidase Rce1-like
VNPFYEELIVRAYLMTELLDFTASPLLAIFASVAVQFSCHLYYGWLIGTGLSAGFLVFSCIICAAATPLPSWPPTPWSTYSHRPPLEARGPTLGF